MSRLGRVGVTVALGALGSLIVHQMAYLVAFPSTRGRAVALADHAHLDTQWALVTPVAVLAVAALIVQYVSNSAIAMPMSASGLATVVLALFVGQEAIEVLLAGGTLATLGSSLAVLAGVALAWPVAWVLARAVSQVREVIARLVKRRVQTHHTRPQWLLVSLVVPNCELRRGTLHVRGPPAPFVTH